jgi:hypothetical protein
MEHTPYNMCEHTHAPTSQHMHAHAHTHLLVAAAEGGIRQLPVLNLLQRGQRTLDHHLCMCVHVRPPMCVCVCACGGYVVGVPRARTHNTTHTHTHTTRTSRFSGMERHKSLSVLTLRNMKGRSTCAFVRVCVHARAGGRANHGAPTWCAHTLLLDACTGTKTRTRTVKGNRPR